MRNRNEALLLLVPIAVKKYIGDVFQFAPGTVIHRNRKFVLQIINGFYVINWCFEDVPVWDSGVLVNIDDYRLNAEE
jgi:hypothetical protein